MHASSDDILEQVRSREVTGVFHSRKALIDAADDLLVAGFDRANIDVSASFDELQRRLNYQSIPPADLADIPIAARQPLIDQGDVLTTDAVVGSLAGCIARSPGKGFGCSLNRSYILLIAWGRPPPRRIEGWAKALRRDLQHGDFLVLIGWDQAAQRQGS